MAAPDVIIVGAGVAGLAAATALVEAGARVLVVEARATPGGRTASFRDRVTGADVDNGQHVVLGCYRETFTYLDRIGARSDIAIPSQLEVPTVDPQGALSRLRCPDWPSPWHLLGGVVSWTALAWRDRLSVLRLARPLAAVRHAEAARRSLRHGRDETVAAWLERHGQTPRVCEVLWEPLALAALNQSIATASAETFVRVMARVFGPNRTDAAIGLPSKPLTDVFGSSARRFLESRGSRLWCHAPARLWLEGPRLSGVTVRGERVAAPVVIAALPWHGWRGFVDDRDAASAGLGAIRSAALAMRSSPIVTVNLWLDRSVITTPFVGLPGRLFHWAFQRNLRGGSWEAHVALVSSGAEAIVQDSQQDLIDRAVAVLRDALPAARGALVVHATAVRERHATFSLAPGQPARPGARTPLPGFFLAGDWTDTGLPATIEGAAQSGHVAAATCGGAGA